MSQTKAQLLGPVLGDVNYDSGTLVIDSTNNRVGIGTTQPTQDFHVYNASLNTDVRAQSGTLGYIDLFHSSSADTYGLWATPTTGRLVFGTNSTERLTILSGGNVGVGTTNPGYKLHVHSGSINVSTRLKSASGESLRLGTTDASNGMELLFSHDTNLFWRIQSVEQSVAYRPLVLQTEGGNVGIGTTNPLSRLHIYTTTEDDGIDIAIARTPSPGEGPSLVFRHNTNNGTQQDFAKIKSRMSNGNDVVWGSNLSFYTGGSSLVENLTIQSSGNVGINSTDPVHRLDVVGVTRVTQPTAGQNGLLIEMPTGSETTASGIKIRGYSPSIELIDKDSIQNWYMAIDDNVTNNFQIARGYGPGQGITSVIDITPSDNVGIGVTNPGNKLVVNGYIQTTYSSVGGNTGLDIGHRRVVSVIGSFAANTWYNTGIARTSDTGIYLLNAWVDTYFGGGQSYGETYIGWFVLPNRASNSPNADEITIHRAGHAPNAELLQFRTLRTPNGDSNIYLQWLSNFALNLDNTGGKTLQIAIHRFGTALNNG